MILRSNYDCLNQCSVLPKKCFFPTQKKKDFVMLKNIKAFIGKNDFDHIFDFFHLNILFVLVNEVKYQLIYIFYLITYMLPIKLIFF